jgi:hypothetical protein
MQFGKELMTTDLREGETTQREERVTHAFRAWSPGQIIAGLIGLLLTVMGGVALARTLPADTLTGPTAEVFGVGHTGLMGIVAIIVGLLFLSQASSPFEVQRGLVGLGALTLAFGLVVVIEPTAFDGALGIGRTGGWLYSAIGLISVVTGVVSPTVTSRE